jgi:serine/threonine protein kinase
MFLTIVEAVDDVIQQSSHIKVHSGLDIWSFGCTLFELLAGRQVFEVKEGSKITLKEVQNQYRTNGIRFPDEFPDNAKEVVSSCLLEYVH